MPFLSPAKLLVILVIGLVVLGPDRLPKFAKQIGGFWADFRKFREKLESEVRGEFPGLPSTEAISQAVRSPLSFLDNLAETHGTQDVTTSEAVGGTGAQVSVGLAPGSLGNDRPEATEKAHEESCQIAASRVVDAAGIGNCARSDDGVVCDPGMN